MENNSKKIEKIFRAKHLRRKELAKLSFDKKTEIVKKLRTTVAGIKKFPDRKQSEI